MQLLTYQKIVEWRLIINHNCPVIQPVFKSWKVLMVIVFRMQFHFWMMSIFLGIIPGYFKFPLGNGCQAMATKSHWQPCQGWALYVLRRENNRDIVLSFFVIGRENNRENCIRCLLHRPRNYLSRASFIFHWEEILWCLDIEYFDVTSWN